MRAHYRVGWLVTALALLAVLTSAGKLPVGWMLPSGNVKVKSAVYATAAPKFCALTFDDGPNGTYMPQVQRILDEQGVKATFFLIGRLVPGQGKAVKALAAAGHELANHSYSHPEMTKYSEAQQRQQIADCQREIEKLGLSAAWFRPPYGVYNRATVRAAGAQKLETVLWSVDPQDWAKPGAERIRNRVLRGVGNGAVVLLHCTNAQTVEALPGIIKHLRDQGYSFLTLSDWRTAAATGVVPQPKTPAGKQPSAAGGAGMETLVPADLAAAATPVADGALEAAADLAGDSVLAGEGAQTVVPDPDEPAPAATDKPKLKFKPLSGAKPQSSNALPVWANFAGPDGAQAIWRSERGGKLRRYKGAALTRQGVGPSGEVVDTALIPGPDVPVAPADSAGETAAPAGEVVASTRDAQSATATAGTAAAPADAAAPAVSLPPLEQRKPLDFRIVDLVDFNNPLTDWEVPATLDPAVFSGYQAQPAPGGMYPGARFYFLSLAPDIEDFTWVELETTIRLGKMSGLLLANEFVSRGPQCALPYPWLFQCYEALDRAAMIDLTTENAADVMDVIAKGKPDIFIIVRPSNLNFFISSHTLAEMGRNLRDFILLRQATAGLPYDPAPALADYWQLPAGVHIGRFTDNKRVALVLYSHDYLPHEVKVPAEFTYFSQVTVDAGGWLRVARLADASVVVDATPVVLYYEYQPQ